MKIGKETQAIYQQEASEQLSLVEEIVLELEAKPQDRDTLNKLFRVFHTIKGSGSMFGFEAIARFTHHIETILDAVRAGNIPFDKSLADLSLSAKDCIASMLDDPAKQAPEAILLELRTRAEALTAESSPKSTAAQARTSAQAITVQGGNSPVPGQLQDYEIQLQLNTDVFKRGLDPLQLLRELGELGQLKQRLLTDAIPPLEALDPELCHLTWDLGLKTACDTNAIKDVFIFVEDDSRILIREASPVSGNAPCAQSSAALRPILPVEAAGCSTEQDTEGPSLSRTTAERDPTGTQSNRQNISDPAVRVPSSRLDELVSIVGELVINHSRLHQLGRREASPELHSALEDLERLVANLRDHVLGIRMMPIGSSFSRFKRLVRDLSSELNREVVLETSGEETELDKNMLDQVCEPLVHLIRNAIDHGMAAPEERERQGKPRTGLVKLSASHEGAHVVIRLEDDGKGLDTTRILKIARERGLIGPDETPNEADLFNLIFLPGFSTARNVTSVSGRGVGMDIVKRQVEALRGTVSLNSVQGRGTTVTLTLPLTLAIIEGLLVGLGEDSYILPLSVVDENVEISAAECATGNGRNLLALRGELIPFVRLRELFGAQGTPPAIERVVIIRTGSHRLGLVVDRVIGTHQTVVQTLGRFYHNTIHFSGATILGDGQVALILDVSGLVNAFQLRGPRTH